MFAGTYLQVRMCRRHVHLLYSLYCRTFMVNSKDKEQRWLAWSITSHHQRPSLSCWLGSTALVQGSHPMDTYPCSCSLFVGTPYRAASQLHCMLSHGAQYYMTKVLHLICQNPGLLTIDTNVTVNSNAVTLLPLCLRR